MESTNPVFPPVWGNTFGYKKLNIKLFPGYSKLPSLCHNSASFGTREGEPFKSTFPTLMIAGYSAILNSFA